ncbi:MAG: UDP-N-acetylglucosamine pyrophosphorylase [Clostridia bacterium]|nr:UDP-N-acetylglucosamine pyrophosphorylase [Clostridia bacterium]
MLQPLTVSALYSLCHTAAAPLLSRVTYPWEALDELEGFIVSLVRELPAEEYRSPAAGVWVHVTARVSPTAYLGQNCIIGADTEVRHGAYIRGGVLVGKGAVIGNSTEVKNAILFDGVQVPHYNYVGDSILGYKAHLGAGAVTSNVKSDRTAVAVRLGDAVLPTERRKLGAMVGDHVEVGCNSVLNPGTIIGRGSRVYPLSCVRGYVPPQSIHKNDGQIVKIR